MGIKWEHDVTAFFMAVVAAAAYLSETDSCYRVQSNLKKQSSCLSLLSAWITDPQHHTQDVTIFL